MTSSVAGPVLLVLGILAGAGSQRVTGLGFALVSAPLMALVVGPYDGVLLANLLSLAVAASTFAATWREVDLRRAFSLAVPALLMVPLGAFTARTLPEPLLMTVVGGVTVLALCSVAFGGRVRLADGRWTAVGAGCASGFMNAAAGAGGSPLALYALGTGWEHRRFVPTTQLCLLLVGSASVTAKGLPDLPGPELALAFAALAAGIGGGHLLARHVPAAAARRAVLWLALTGSAVTTVKGVLAW
ncbi:sulfite exporter TauE/SafE family protein [Streptomyces sp. ODS28]|uniref:sulfite exporter TauE/SafE family protein n=1 Tax=Streptomyces sp. ODS28 TaxID=3136688 RepID=UPI0031ED0F9D